MDGEPQADGVANERLFEASRRCGVAEVAPSAGYGLDGLAQLAAG